MILSSACCGILCFIFASQLFQVLIAKSIAFGIHIDGSADFHNIQNPKDAADRYGGHLAAYGMFLDVTSNGFEDNIVAFEASIDNPNSILLLSAMPNGGFDAFTDDKRGKLVSLCKQLNAKGRHIILRFAHEMNGDWYTYGGKSNTANPPKFKATFSALADQIHAQASKTVMMWSPNTVSFSTDPNSNAGFTPYWPGDDKVDLVGISAYYFGETKDFQHFTSADPNSATSASDGKNVIGQMLDAGGFYSSFVIGKNKPFWYAETGIATYPDINTATRIKFKDAFVELLHEEMQRRDNVVGVTYFDLDKPAELRRSFAISNDNNKRPCSSIVKLIGDKSFVLATNLNDVGSTASSSSSSASPTPTATQTAGMTITISPSSSSTSSSQTTTSSAEPTSSTLSASTTATSTTPTTTLITITSTPVVVVTSPSSTVLPTTATITTNSMPPVAYPSVPPLPSSTVVPTSITITSSSMPTSAYPSVPPITSSTVLPTSTHTKKKRCRHHHHHKKHQ